MRTVICLLSLLTVALATAQGVQTTADVARQFVVEKMEADWTSTVAVTWGETRELRSGDELTFFGYGLVRRESTGLDAVFVFEVKIYTIRRIAPQVSYNVLHWSNTPVDDKYLASAARAIVTQRLLADTRTELRIDFADPQISNASPETRVVEGSGTFSGRSGWITGNFKYSVRFSRKTGAIERVDVTAAPSNPGVGYGGYNAYTEGVAQAHVAEYVRKREGFQVHVQFTGPVTHTLISKEVDRVTGRGQWRRGNNFAWNDFRYDVQVGVDDGKVVSATVSLTPDTHGNPEDQKFVTFAQAAVRRDFKFQSNAEITFLTSKVTSVTFGKKSVAGEFSAGGKRYAYTVVIDAATTRTDSVSIRPN